MKLEYLGELTHEGKKCHRVRSWTGGFFMNKPIAIRDWLIDAQSWLPLACGQCQAGYRLEFLYRRVNEPIAVAAFRPPADFPRKPFELEAGYDHFFLNACDGSNGRMSVPLGATRGQRHYQQRPQLRTNPKGQPAVVVLPMNR